MLILINANGQTKEYELDSFRKDVVSFGRSSECDIRINVDYVSRLHGCFYKEDGRWYIKNLESKHGIIYKDKKIDYHSLSTSNTFTIRPPKGSNSQVQIVVVKGSGSAVSNTSAGSSGSAGGDSSKKNSDLSGLGKASASSRKKGDDNTMIIATVLIAVVALLLVVGVFVVINRGGKMKDPDDGWLIGNLEDNQETTEASTESSTESSEEDAEEPETTEEESTEAYHFTEDDLKDYDYDSEKYFEENSEIKAITKVEDAKNVLTEKETIKMLGDRGFTEYDAETSYDMSGGFYEHARIINSSSDDKHPIYQTYYINSNEEVWTILVVENEVYANPVSYNLDSDLDVQVLVSEKEVIKSYDGFKNSYYDTIPNKSALFVIKKDSINSKLLDELTVSEIDKLVK